MQYNYFIIIIVSSTSSKSGHYNIGGINKILNLVVASKYISISSSCININNNSAVLVVSIVLIIIVKVATLVVYL